MAKHAYRAVRESLASVASFSPAPPIEVTALKRPGLRKRSRPRMNTCSKS